MIYLDNGATSFRKPPAVYRAVRQAMETCAVPIFAYLLVEGWQHTASKMNYAKRVLGLGLISEIPYNFAMTGKILDVSSRNPVFGIALCMIALYFYDLYEDKCFKNTAVKLLVTVAAFLWSNMLKIEYGSATVLITATLWAFRKNTLYRNFAGAAATIVCTVMSMYFLAAPMAFMIVHGYDGEKSTNSRTVNYLAYPVILMAAAIVGFIL